MNEYLEKIEHLSLFCGIKKKDLSPMLSCLGCYVRTYRKKQFIILSEEAVKCAGVVLSGSIHMIKEDSLGSKTILTCINRGEIFGETFACGSSQAATVTFFAAQDTAVLFLPFYKILHTCNLSCVFHHKLVENMVTLIADKNVRLMEKIEVTSKKNLRDKILTYLSLQSARCQSRRFEIPLGRVELAEYLCSDRSALTRELNSMKKDGLLEYNKNTFCLL